MANYEFELKVTSITPNTSYIVSIWKGVNSGQKPIIINKYPTKNSFITKFPKVPEGLYFVTVNGPYNLRIQTIQNIDKKNKKLTLDFPHGTGSLYIKVEDRYGIGNEANMTLSQGNKNENISFPIQKNEDVSEGSITVRNLSVGEWTVAIENSEAPYIYIKNDNNTWSLTSQKNVQIIKDAQKLRAKDAQKLRAIALFVTSRIPIYWK